MLGFAGVLANLQPGALPFSGYMLLPFAAALLYALAMMVTHTRCAKESPLILALVLNLAIVSIGVLATLAGLAMPIPQALE